MGIRYQGKFTDDTGATEWTVNIIDTNYQRYSERVDVDGGTIEGLSCLPDDLWELVEYKYQPFGSNGFNLTYGERGNDAFKGIKGSRLDITFIASDEADVAFLEEVAQTQEDQFYIDAYKNGNLFWRGVVLQDLVRIPYNAPPFAVEFQAVCGLARLKGIKDEIPDAKFNNLLNLIIYMMGEQDVLTASTDDFVRTSVRWYEDQMWTSSPPVGLDALAYSRVFKDYSHEIKKEDGSTEFRDWAETLECILHTFGARMFYADGLWNIIQISEYAESPSRYNVYKKNYSISTPVTDPTTATGITSTGTPWDTFIQLSATGSSNRVKNGSEYGFLPAIGTASVTYDFDQLLAPELREWLRANTTEYEIGGLPVDGRYNFLFEQGNYNVQNSSGSEKLFRWRQTVRIRFVGTSNTYYLAPLGNGYTWQATATEILIVPNYVALAPSGTTTFSGTNEANGIISPLFNIPAGATAPLPENGTLYVRTTVTLLNANGTGAHPDLSLATISSGASPNLLYKYRGTEVIVRATNAGSDGALGKLKSFTFSVDNATLQNSTEVKEYPKVFIGDSVSTTGNTNGEIRVYNVTSGDSEKSSTWKFRGTGTGDFIHALKLKIAMGIFELPRRLFDIKYRGGHPGYKALELSNKVYVWNYISTDARQADHDIEAYEVDITPTAYTVDIDDILEPREPASFTNQLNGKTTDLTGGITDTLSLLTSSASGTVTSLSIGELSTTLGFAGDVIRVMDSDGSFETFILSQDAVQGVTTISVESKVLSEPIQPGAIIQRATSENAFRSYSQTKFPISAIPDAELILQDSGVETTSGLITTWSDSSGSGNNFTGVDVTPNYKGGFYAQLDGVSSYLSNGSININQPFSLVMLLRLTESTSGKYLFEASIGDFSIITATAPDLTISTGTGPTNATIEIPRDVWNVFQLRVNGASSQFRVNYDSWTNITLDASALIEAPYIGYDGSSNFCETDLAAACIFAKVLTDDEANAIVNNFKARIS